MMAPIVCIMGPTASGKSDAALRIAEKGDAEIISVDSASIYRGLDIGAAKPSKAILEKIPHHLIDILDPEDSYSAAQFVLDAHKAIAEILAKGKKPLLVGGTMLYFKALQYGLSDLPEADDALRKQIAQEIKENGLAALHEELKRVDPESAAKIHVNDPQRLSRAIELYRLTGKSRSDLWAESSIKSPYTYENIAIIPKDRTVLHQRIEQRFLAMCEAGFEMEVKKLMQRPGLDLSKPAMRSVGYRQMWQYLQGEYSFDEMQAKAIAATRQLAKRQMTWLRSWPDVAQKLEFGSMVQ